MRPTLAAPLLFLVLPATAASQIVKDRTLARPLTALPTGAPPTYLQASPGTTSIYLRWVCPDGAFGYDVYVTPAGGGQVKLTPAPIPAPCVQDIQVTAKMIPGMPAPSTAPTYSLGYTHSGVVPGSSYTYVVVALYPNGASAVSAAIPTKANLAPPPAGFVATANGRSANLQWQSVSGATGYRIFRKLASESGFQELSTGGTTATSYSDQTLLPPWQHQYYVQAVNGLPSAAGTVSIPPLPAPPALNVSAPSYDMVQLSWQLPFDLRLMPRGYLVFRQREGEAGFSQITATPVPALSYQDHGVRPGQRVSYYVKGVDGDPTPPVSVVPGAVKVVSVVGSCGKGGLDFRFSASGGATGVNVLRGETPGGPFYVAAVSYADITAGVIRTVTNPIGVNQYYKLQAVYPTGITESVLIPLTIPTQRPKDSLFDKFFATPVPGTTVEWQCPP